MVTCIIEKIEDFPVLTQGFIGCTSENFTTTLGREGSDFTAAVLANILDAEKVIIWKYQKGLYRFQVLLNKFQIYE